MAEMPAWQKIGAEEALTWLDERIGRTVTLYVIVVQGDSSSLVLDILGQLAHWSVGAPAEASIGEAPSAGEGAPADERGLYAVGESHVDLGAFREAEYSVRPAREQLRVVTGNMELGFALPTWHLPRTANGGEGREA